MLTDPGKFGYYIVGDRSYISKYEASIAGTPSWYFNDREYSQYDWSEDPQLDLRTLYKLRARQIREKYDYVVLWYSGGSDSYTMLDAWISEGLKIDEIATFWDYDSSGDKYNFLNAEVTKVVLPHITALREAGHEFKFRLVDQNDLNLNFVRRNVLIEACVNWYSTINCMSKNFIRDYVKDYADMIDSGKKVAFVWGKEKPFIGYENGKYYFQFYDQIDDCVGPYVQSVSAKRGWFDEFFYWTPDLPLITIQQVHKIKNFLDTCHDPQFYTDEKVQWGYNPTLDKYLRKDPYMNLIYPTWNTNTFTVGKGTLVMKERLTPHSFRDTTFLRSNMDEKTRYISALDSFMKDMTDRGLFSNNQVKKLYTRKYWL